MILTCELRLFGLGWGFGRLLVFRDDIRSRLGCLLLPAFGLV
jgi:hypothetical protein